MPQVYVTKHQIEHFAFSLPAQTLMCLAGIVGVLGVFEEDGLSGQPHLEHLDLTST